MAKLKVEVEVIKVDPEVLPRDSKSKEVLKEYTDVIRRGETLPDPVVFNDGKTIWLADGLYRLLSHKDLKLKTIVCDLRQGSREDAIWYAAGANREHGMPLTATEKRRAADNVLRTPELAKKSNPIIGEQTGFTGARIQQFRAALEKKGAIAEQTTLTDIKGRTRSKPSSGSTKKTSGATRAASGTKSGESKPSAQKTRGPKLKDGLGKTIPDWGREFVTQMKPINDWLTKLSTLSKDYAALRQTPAGSQLDAVVCATIDEIANTVQQSKFFCVCDPCREAENIRKSCKTCKGRGWLSRQQYDKTLEK